MFAFSKAMAADVSIDSLMGQLDKVIAERELFIQQKEKRITQLRQSIDTEHNKLQRFDMLGKLLGEYAPFNTDSAYAVALRREAIAREIGEEEFILHAMMNRAEILNATAMYKECVELMDSVPFSRIPSYLHPFYFHIKRTVFGRLADFATFAPDKAHYARLTDMYRDSLLAINDASSLEYALIKADKLNAANRAAEALGVLQEYGRGKKMSEHEQAICAWTLSESYELLGDTENQKRQLLISAISDMKSAVREYVSLRQLALMLYNEGDLVRAHRFMTICVDDAEKCNARQRIVEINALYKKVNGIYIDKIQEQKGILSYALLAISVMMVVMCILFYYTWKKKKQVAEARKIIQEAYGKLESANYELLETNNKLHNANDKLHNTNDQLHEANNKLHDANREIADISAMKEVYIGRYMDQCLEYIDKIDDYRKNISRQLGAGKTAELKKSLQSTTAIDREYKAFYEQFDRTFLSIFPTFVSDFNKLLQPDEAIIPKKEGGLNAELRIFALIRLGISDSESIAKFLRYSLPTIYTYRTKVRNKALGDRNLLEQELMKIGRM